MVSQGEILLHRWQADGATQVAFSHLCGGRSGIEIEIDAAANCAPGQTPRLQLHLLAMGVSQEHSMGEGQMLFRGRLAIDGSVGFA